MALRKHRPGELVIEQTRDLVRVREILASAGMMTDGIEWPAACYILAYNGDEPIGVIGIEVKIDAALIRSLYVKPAMRQRGIGAGLLAAAICISSAPKRAVSSRAWALCSRTSRTSSPHCQEFHR
jgi:N-acetylglutamate synthase-like GNAT family acetyltransferase